MSRQAWGAPLHKLWFGSPTPFGTSARNRHTGLDRAAAGPDCSEWSIPRDARLPATFGSYQRLLETEVPRRRNRACWHREPWPGYSDFGQWRDRPHPAAFDASLAPHDSPVRPQRRPLSSPYIGAPLRDCSNSRSRPDAGYPEVSSASPELREETSQRRPDPPFQRPDIRRDQDSRQPPGFPSLRRYVGSTRHSRPKVLLDHKGPD